MSEERLDRIESLVEKIGQQVDSNARAIEDLANEWQKDREEWQKDRNRLYDVMTRVASAQATFWEIQGDYYRRLEEVDKRQADIIEILKRLTEKADN